MFCRNCGTEFADNASFCPKCGTPVANNAPVQPQVMNGDADVQQNRGIAWLSYLGLLLLVPLFARKNSDYCKFHVKQGAALFAVSVAYEIVYLIIMAIVRAIIPSEKVRVYGIVIGERESAAVGVIGLILGLVFIFFSVLAIIGIVNAATGKRNKLPLIGNIPFIDNLMEKIYAAINK